MVSDKIRALLKLKGKEYIELATHLGIRRQALHNKLHRDTYTAVDLIKIAEFFNVELAFIDDKIKIPLDISDIKEKTEES